MFGKNKAQNTAKRQTRQVGRAQTYYYKQGDSHTSAERPTSQRGRWWQRLQNLPTYMAAIVIIGCLLYTLSLSTTPKIVVVNDQDSAIQPFLRTATSYQTVASQELTSSFLNRTKLTFNTMTVAEALRAQLPEATDISITLPILGRSPVIYMRIAEPAFLLASEAGIFVVDEQGRAVINYQDMPQTDITKDLLKLTDESGTAIEPGQQAMTKDHVSFIIATMSLLKEKGMGVEKMVLPAQANELHLYPQGEKYFVKYNFLLDVKEQTGKYLATKTQLRRDASSAKQYIDVRVEDRVYVR